MVEPGIPSVADIVDWLAQHLILTFFSLFNSNYRNWKSKILAFLATLVLRVAL